MRKLFLSWLKAVGISGTGRMRCAQWPWLQRTQIFVPLLITHEYRGAIRAESLPMFAVTGMMVRGGIASALKARLGRDVERVCKSNEKLIGGAAIRAGDLVIDGSVRARLEKLAAAVGA